MKDTATFRRTALAACLILAAVSSVVWVLLEPPFPDGYAARLAAVDEAGAGAMVSATVFTWSQLPMLVALLTIAHISRPGAPRLATVGGGLGALGAFGHAVFGGAMLVTVLMARDSAHRAVHAGLLEQIESTPALMVFAAAGLLGTVLAFLLLGIGLWRSRVVPRWVAAALLAFLVVEFVGTAFTELAGYLGLSCLVVAFGALALHVWRAPLEVPRPSPDSPRAPVPA